MKTKLIGAAMALLMCSGVASATDTAAEDNTPVTQCEGLPSPILRIEDAIEVCQEMIRVLHGVRRKDITNFDKVIIVLQSYDYEGGYGGNVPQVAKELVEIIRLRGLEDQPERWSENNDLIFRAWMAVYLDSSGKEKPATDMDKIIGPRQIINFLQASGPMAKTLSDKGLANMIAYMKIQHRKGNPY